MTAPAEITPPYKHTPLFPLGPDTTPYRKLGAAGVRVERSGKHELVVVEREALRTLAETAFTDINHLLRPSHLAQLRAILEDPQASDNDKFVAYDFLKNANIAAGGTLPMCQDTGTVLIMGKKMTETSPYAGSWPGVELLTNPADVAAWLTKYTAAWGRNLP